MTVIFVMGIISMAMLTMMGSFLVGKVGGAERVGSLKADLVAIYGGQMEDPDTLSVRVASIEDRTGLVVEYRPKADFAKNRRAVEKQMGRVANFVLGAEYWRKRSAFVKVRANLPGGKVVEKIYDRPAPNEPS